MGRRMHTERIQRQIDQLLDQAEEAIARRDWDAARECAQAVLRVDAENQDARGYLALAGDQGAPESIASAPSDYSAPERRI